jgi:tellurite resistance protein TerC
VLFVALVMVETADGIFAFDSIPAGLALTRDPFILFASNVLAVLTVRSIFPLLMRFTGWLRYFKIALTLVLMYLAAKMLIPGQMLDIHPEISLGVIFAILTGGAVASILGSAPDPTVLTTRPSPLGEDAERLARLTLKQVRKVMVLIVGTIVVLAGIGMLIGPGPGLVVIPIGLAILATEFVWAKRLLDRYAQYASKLGKRAGAAVMNRTRLWHVPVVIAITVAGWIAIYKSFNIPIHTLLMGFLPMLIGQIVWGVMLYIKRKKQRAGVDQPREGT